MNIKDMSKEEIEIAIRQTHPLLPEKESKDYANEIKTEDINTYSKRVLAVYLVLEEYQTWKVELCMVMDNPDYIEEQIKHIQVELTKDRPETTLLKQYANKIIEWANEIDLAKGRAEEKA